MNIEPQVKPTKLKGLGILVLVVLIFARFSGQADVSVTTLVSFTGTNGLYLGANPYAALIQGVDSNFYGTTELGGSNNLGTVFCMTPGGALTTLVSFTATNGPSLGANPYGGLVQASNGVLYGTTRNGGTNNRGTVFQITTNGVLTTLFNFGGANGSSPMAGLLLASDGYLYGTTFLGGLNNKGTVFQMATDGAMNVLVSFRGGTNGNAPMAALIQGMDGAFYGTTWAGGNLFQVKTDGTIINLVVFTGGSGPFLGMSPEGRLVQDAYGNLYGTTDQGGTYDAPYGWGTVFKLATNGVFTTLHSFDSSNGANPHAGAILGRDGNLYGVTVAGGTWGVGTVFQLTTNGVFTFLYSFDGDTNCSCYPYGGFPYAELVQASDGRFYGAAEIGGRNGYGAIFRISLEPVFQFVVGTNHQVQLSWNAISNKTYQLSFKTNLVGATWLNLGSPITATNGTMSISDTPGPDTQRFYRLELLP